MDRRLIGSLLLAATLVLGSISVAMAQVATLRSPSPDAEATSVA